jgi:hypothetical protein
MRRAVPGAVLLAGTLVFVGYYNQRVYGNALTPPYKLNRDTYAVVPIFVWQSPRPEPVYRHRVMRNFYAGNYARTELTWFRESFLSRTLVKILASGFFFLNFALAPLLLGLPRALRDRRIRVALVMMLVLAGGMLVGNFFMPHYAAPAILLLYLLLLQCMRHVRTWGPSGLMLVRLTPLLCLVLAVCRVSARPLNIELPLDTHAPAAWYGSGPIGAPRAGVLSQLEGRPGRQLAIVRYQADHVYPEWVYNAADLEASKVIWAREMDPAETGKLLSHFRDRTAWLIEPDANPPKVSAYPASVADGAGVGP